jgi:hypothetical protein
MKLCLAIALLVTAFNCFSEEIFFADRIVTFTNDLGRKYERLKLVKVDARGLHWVAAQGEAGGRIDLAELTPAVCAQIGMDTPTVEKLRAEQQLVDEVNSHTEARLMHAQSADERDKILRTSKIELALRMNTGRGKFLESIVREKDAVILKVGAPYYRMLDGEKRDMAALALAYGVSKTNTCEKVIIQDAFSAKKLGAYTAKAGLKLTRPQVN